MNANDILMDLINRYPELSICVKDIKDTFEMIKSAFSNNNKLLIAGNGGSAADSEHIVGELMKSFKFKRPLVIDYQTKLINQFGHEGEILAGKLEGALPAISLPSMTALMTACVNDNEADAVFAQMVVGLGMAGDILLAISTSGNSANIYNACMVAKAKGMKVIGLTGKSGGRIKKLCDKSICVPAIETHIVQEYHLPVYHVLCSMLEFEFFACPLSDTQQYNPNPALK